ncbi:MAG: ribosome-associated translation inhibitor RaiA [Clostridia bacterium]|nr:ribosome-associated translation inhibitor RaiA [Clostridia bacterium]
MTVIFAARKVTLKDNFKERTEKKLNKFSRIFSDEARAKVTVTVYKNNQTVEVTIIDKGMIYRSEASCAQMNDALDKVLDNLGRQIRKHKTKLAKKLKTAHLAELFIEQEKFNDLRDEINENEDYDLVRVKHFTLHPMSVQEAILQMNMLEHKFFIFKNLETNEINVIYSRKDGTYGLIDPQ